MATALLVMIAFCVVVPGALLLTTLIGDLADDIRRYRRGLERRRELASIRKGVSK